MKKDSGISPVDLIVLHLYISNETAMWKQTVPKLLQKNIFKSQKYLGGISVLGLRF